MSRATCKKLQPCPSCPWRTDQGASAIPNYDQAKAENLLNTVGDGDAFRPIMACHHSQDGREIACKGYLARAGWSNLNVRVGVMSGLIDNPTAVIDACIAAKIVLEPNYPAVLAKLSNSKTHYKKNERKAHG